MVVVTIEQNQVKLAIIVEIGEIGMATTAANQRSCQLVKRTIAIIHPDAMLYAMVIKEDEIPVAVIIQVQILEVSITNKTTTKIIHQIN